MRKALISLEETDAERTVIVSEREGLENDPSFLLGEKLQSIAFSRHPYGQGVIGSKDEIKLMTRDGLYAHYRRFYAPNNAFVVVSGDDDAERLIEQAAAAFGPLDPCRLGGRRRRPSRCSAANGASRAPRGWHAPARDVRVPRAARRRSAGGRDVGARGHARRHVTAATAPLAAPRASTARWSRGARGGRRRVVPVDEGPVPLFAATLRPGSSTRRWSAHSSRSSRSSARSCSPRTSSLAFGASSWPRRVQHRHRNLALVPLRRTARHRRGEVDHRLVRRSSRRSPARSSRRGRGGRSSKGRATSAGSRRRAPRHDARRAQRARERPGISRSRRSRTCATR